jgi:hypothetical protein
MRLHPVRWRRYAAVAILPVGAQARYSQEYRADLAALSGRQAFRYAVSVLLGAPRLRWTLLQGDPTLADQRPLICRIGLHAYVEVHDNPEDLSNVALHCRRCGVTKDPKRDLQRKNADNVAWVGAHWQG